jgi:hypothetical protein
MVENGATRVTYNSIYQLLQLIEVVVVLAEVRNLAERQLTRHGECVRIHVRVHGEIHCQSDCFSEVQGGPGSSSCSSGSGCFKALQ